MISRREFSADRMARARMIAEREAFEKASVAGGVNWLADKGQQAMEAGRGMVHNIKQGQADRAATKTTAAAGRTEAAAGNADQRTFDAANPGTQKEEGGFVADAAKQRAQDATVQQRTAMQAQTAPPLPAAGPAAPAAVNPQQQAAQNMALNADAAALQQGKGGDKQSWMKNRSGMGKFADVMTGGLTAGLGSTGMGARNKANTAATAQTDRFNQANTNMGMRAQGQTPTNLKFASAERIHDSIGHIMIRKQMQR